MVRGSVQGRQKEGACTSRPENRGANKRIALLTRGAQRFSQGKKKIWWYGNVVTFAAVNDNAGCSTVG